ncbi:MAG: zinc-binding dehydrogenase [Rhodothermales bacterium]|nr:zinc-binding dehydrogenase [Rhodothermales bacterium]
MPTNGGQQIFTSSRHNSIVRSVVSTRFTDKSVVFAFARENTEGLRELKMLIESGQVTPVVDCVYPMDEAAASHRRVETEQQSGIVVPKIGDAPASS